MARRSGFVRRHGVMRRETLWISIPAAVTTLAAASTSALVGVFNAAALALRPFTIVRVRGYWHVRSDQIATSELWGASMGYSVVSDQAAAIGVTAVPVPETDRDSDLFFLYESMWGTLNEQGALAAGFSFIETGRGEHFDSKAMRKVEQGQDLAITVETPSTVASAVVHEGGRMLVKLH